MATAAMADTVLESRIARLESDVAHIRTDIVEMKLDIREMRQEVAALDRRIADLDHQLTRSLSSNRIWVLLQGAAILGVMARGFHWL